MNFLTQKKQVKITLHFKMKKKLNLSKNYHNIEGNY